MYLARGLGCQSRDSIERTRNEHEKDAVLGVGARGGGAAVLRKYGVGSRCNRDNHGYGHRSKWRGGGRCDSKGERYWARNHSHPPNGPVRSIPHLTPTPSSL